MKVETALSHSRKKYLIPLRGNGAALFPLKQGGSTVPNFLRGCLENLVLLNRPAFFKHGSTPPEKWPPCYLSPLSLPFPFSPSSFF